jgi:hypothetical protein
MRINEGHFNNVSDKYEEEFGAFEYKLNELIPDLRDTFTDNVNFAYGDSDAIKKHLMLLFQDAIKNKLRF